jgi:hypothetical protein
VFAETRPLAEEWTYRWLGAVLAESVGVEDVRAGLDDEGIDEAGDDPIAGA